MMRLATNIPLPILSKKNTCVHSMTTTATTKLCSFATLRVPHVATCFSSPRAPSFGQQRRFGCSGVFPNVTSWRWWLHIKKNEVSRMLSNALLCLGWDVRLPPNQRKRIVVVGAGWSSLHFLKKINVAYFDITIVSPRHVFSFTPFLPCVCGGSLTPSSCAEPIRDTLLFRGRQRVMTLLKACVTDVHHQKNTVSCSTSTGDKFDVPYDFLVISAGTQSSDFNIPGVAENAATLKTVEDARAIHLRVLENFEKASLPTTSAEERKRLLNFVIVGGGPTGVETAAEIADFINHDLVRCFGPIARDAKVTLVEMLPRLLASFSPKASAFTLRNLEAINVDVFLQTRVKRIDPMGLFVECQDQENFISSAFVLWASGVAPATLVQHLLKKFPLPKGRGLPVNERLQVTGIAPNVFAFGDCVVVNPTSLVSQAPTISKGLELDYPRPASSCISSNLGALSLRFPQVSTDMAASLLLTPIKTHQEFLQLLNRIDKSYVSPPPTAQNAVQQGEFLAHTFNHYIARTTKIDGIPAYRYKWKGTMAYVGGGKSVVETPHYGSWCGGHFIDLFRKFFYWNKLPSPSSKMLCALDFFKLRTRGRNFACERFHALSPSVKPLSSTSS